MYYFLYSCEAQRRRGLYSRSKQPTKFNKFDLDWMQAGIRRRYKIYDSKHSHALMQLLRDTNVIPDLPRHIFILEIPEPMDAMWAKLNAENLTKNNDRYGMQYHGCVGPVTEETFTNIREEIETVNLKVASLKENIQYAHNIMRFAQITWSTDNSIRLNDTVRVIDEKKILALKKSYHAIIEHISSAKNEIMRVNKILSDETEKARQEINKEHEQLNKFIKEQLGV